MEEDEQLQSTAIVSDQPTAQEAPATSGVHAQGVIGVLIAVAVVTLIVRRISRANLAGNLRRWLPVVYTGVWGVAVLAVTLIYARGLSSTWFLAIWLVFLGVAFASVGWLRSVVSGVAISMEGRIKLGDSIRVNSATGEVIGFGVRAMRLRAADGSIHEIPNEKLVTESVTNLSGDGGDAAAELVVPIPAGVDAQAALEIARRIAILTPLASPRHRPEVFLEAGGVDGQRFDIRVRGFAFDAAYRDHFRSDVVSRIQAEFTRRSAAVPE